MSGRAAAIRGGSRATQSFSPRGSHTASRTRVSNHSPHQTTYSLETGRVKLAARANLPFSILYLFIGGENLMETLWQDLRYALRSLSKKTDFTTVVALTLALGIGAVSAVSSFFNAALLRPLPYEQSERIAQLQSTESARAGAYFSQQ